MQQKKYDFADKALPMVAVDEKSGKYVLTQQAREFFRNITGHIAVVSVAGLYRTGKSYLLNRVLLQKSFGFGVGPTVNPCTKGLWFWGRPISGTSNDGEPVNIIVIDTEGIGALDEDQTHDTKIFTLAILASSCFVYNSVGSIDETAIQNLSLVVNLTKHIQLKAEQDDEEEGVDPEEISTYFPTFYWVVRDFSLQLQDPEGNPITPKEYLERALAPQNGFSDDVEEKNRIRRLLTAFFKERDCITMIRPLVDETKLQNLDKMDLEQLRYDFVQQAQTFRKRIVTAIKPKTLHGQKLNGGLYCSMIDSYVNAINDGAVPNIENAWNYMCEEQCRQTIGLCFKIFIDHIKENLKELPRPEDDVNLRLAEAEEKAVETYREKAMGSYSPHGLVELRAQIKEQRQDLVQKNIKQSYTALREYIVRNASIITKKLNSQQYSSYSEYEKEIAAMYEKFLKDGPKLHNYKFVYLEAVKKLSSQGAEFLFRNFNKQQEKTSEMFKEKEKQMSGEIQTLRTECEGIRKKYNESMTEADQKILNLTNREESLQKQLDMTIQSKREEESKMQRYYGSRDSENKAALRELQDKLGEMTGRLDETTKQFLLEQQAWAKERAIMEQQAKYQQLQIEELQKKERSLDAAINLSKTNMSKEVREITIRLETDRDSLKTQLEAKVEKLNELTEELNNLKDELNEKSDKFEKKEKKFKDDMAALKRDSEKARKDLEMEKKQLRDELLSQESTLREEFQSTDSKLKESEAAVRELTEKLRTTKNEMEKQRLLLQQAMQFTKQQNDSLRSKVLQLKESHEMALASYQASMNQENQESMSRRIVEMKNEHVQEIERLNHTFDSEKNRMNYEFSNLNTRHFELEAKHNAFRTQKDLEEKDYKCIIEELRIQIATLTADKIRIENELLDEIATKEEMWAEEKKSLNRDLEEAKAAASAEIEKITQAKESEMGMIKQQAAEEVDKAKKRQKDTNEKLKKKLQEEMEEASEQAYQEKLALQTELEETNETLKNTEAHLENMAKELQHANDILAKENATLAKDYRELKEAFEKREQDYNAREDAYTKKAVEQSAKQSEKIELMSHELREKEKEFVALKHEKEQFKDLAEKTEAQALANERELKKSEERFKADTERINAKIKEVEGEAMEKYSTLSTEYALLNQKFQFESNRAHELETQLTANTEVNERKFETYKSEKEAQVKNISAKLHAEKAQLDGKYQQLKTAHKELDSTHRKVISDAQKSIAVLEEKNNHLEGKLAESEASKAEEIGNLRSELVKSRETLAVREKESKESIFALNSKISALENEVSDLKSNLDKERSLAQQSTTLFQKIKEDIKRESEERIRTLEMQLAREQNNRMADKNALDSNHSRTLTDFDLRYRQKTQELNDVINKTRHELQLITKDKDSTIKELTEKYETEKTMRSANNATLERRNSELTATNKQQAEEIERLRRLRNVREEEKMRKQNEDKQALKRAVEAVEAKWKEKQEKLNAKMAELNRVNYLIKYEKESMEENLHKVEDEKEKLAKMVTKLNAEKERLKNTKPTTTVKTTSYISSLKPTYEPSKVERTVVQENKENTSFQ